MRTPRESAWRDMPPAAAHRRADDWQRQLNEYLIGAQARYRETGLAWGAFDCCTFAFDWVLRITGADPMAPWRGRYACEREALEILRAVAAEGHGDGTLRGAMASWFGEPFPAAFAQRGDVIYRASEKAAGIVVTIGGRTNGMFLGENGLAALPPVGGDLGFRV